MISDVICNLRNYGVSENKSYIYIVYSLLTTVINNYDKVKSVSSTNSRVYNSPLAITGGSQCIILYIIIIMTHIRHSRLHKGAIILYRQKFLNYQLHIKWRTDGQNKILLYKQWLTLGLVLFSHFFFITFLELSSFF